MLVVFPRAARSARASKSTQKRFPHLIDVEIKIMYHIEYFVQDLSDFIILFLSIYIFFVRSCATPRHIQSMYINDYTHTRFVQIFQSRYRGFHIRCPIRQEQTSDRYSVSSIMIALFIHLNTKSVLPE